MAGRIISPKDLVEELGSLGATGPSGLSGGTLIQGPGQTPEVFITKLGIEAPGYPQLPEQNPTGFVLYGIGGLGHVVQYDFDGSMFVEYPVPAPADGGEYFWFPENGDLPEQFMVVEWKGGFNGFMSTGEVLGVVIASGELNGIPYDGPYASWFLNGYVA